MHFFSSAKHTVFDRVLRHPYNLAVMMNLLKLTTLLWLCSLAPAFGQGYLSPLEANKKVVFDFYRLVFEPTAIAYETPAPTDREEFRRKERVIVQGLRGLWAVKELLFDYVKSPSLRHIRDPFSVTKLAHEIVRRVDRGLL